MKHLEKNALKGLKQKFRGKNYVHGLLNLSHMEEITLKHLAEVSLGHDSDLYGQKLDVGVPKNDPDVRNFHAHLHKHGKVKTAHAMMRRGGSGVSIGKSLIKGVGKMATKVAKKAAPLLQDLWNGVKKGAKKAVEWGTETFAKGAKWYGQHEGAIKKGAAVTSQVLQAATPLVASLLSEEDQKLFNDIKGGVSGYASGKPKGEKKDTGGGSFHNFDSPNVHLSL